LVLLADLRAVKARQGDGYNHESEKPGHFRILSWTISTQPTGGSGIISHLEDEGEVLLIDVGQGGPLHHGKAQLSQIISTGQQ